MEFPHANKLNEGLKEQIESSAELLEQHLRKIDYKVFLRAYFLGLGIILVTLFSIIVTVRLAYHIF